MATQLKDPFVEWTAEDMRHEHEEALRIGASHPGYERASWFQAGAENASGNLTPDSVEELLQETFQALAETRNRHLQAL